jgi:hypothetical protein
VKPARCDNGRVDDGSIEYHRATEIVAYEPGYDNGVSAEPGTKGEWVIYFNAPEAEDIITGYLTLPGEAGQPPSAIEGLPYFMNQHGLRFVSDDPWEDDCPGLWSARVDRNISG